MKAWGLDCVNFAPYKFGGARGLGVGWLSERVMNLPHRKLIKEKQSNWEMGGCAPGMYAMLSAIVDYVCWIGKQFKDCLLYTSGSGKGGPGQCLVKENMRLSLWAERTSGSDTGHLEGPRRPGLAEFGDVFHDFCRSVRILWRGMDGRLRSCSVRPGSFRYAAVQRLFEA